MLAISYWDLIYLLGILEPLIPQSNNNVYCSVVGITILGIVNHYHIT